MKKVTSLLLLAGVAAFGLVGCGDDETPPGPPDAQPQITSVTVTPSDISIEPGQTAQVRADFQTEGGVEGLSVAWSSGNENVATVSPTGDQTAEVTGQSSGTVSVTATVSASNANSQSASAGVTVEQIEDATLSIGEITNQAGNPVNVANVAGQINVEINVEKADEDVDQVSLLVDGEVVSTQDFGSGNVEAQDVSAQSNVEVVVFNFRTDRLEGSVPGNVVTAQNVSLDGNVKRGQFDNSEHTISAQLTTGSGAVRSAENSQTLNFNNDNLAIAAHLSGGQGVVEPVSGTRYWGGEDIEVSVTPVIFDGGLSAGSVTISANSGGQTASGSGSIVFDSPTVSSEPFVFDILQADNAGGIEDARGAPDGPGNNGSDLGIGDIRDADGATVVGQFTLVQMNDFFLDFNAPDAGGSVTFGGVTTTTPADGDNPYYSGFQGNGTVPIILPGVSDDGVGGTFSAPSSNFVIDIIDSNTPSTAGVIQADVSATWELSEQAPNSVSTTSDDHWAHASSYEDNLGNGRDFGDAGFAVSTPVGDFGVDQTAVAESNQLPGSATGSSPTGFVFNADGTATGVLSVDLADPALSNGETPSGLNTGSVMVTVEDQSGNTLAGPAAANNPSGTTWTDGGVVAGTADGPQFAFIVHADQAEPANGDSQAWTYIKDTTAPNWSALNPAPTGSSGTGANAIVMDIGGSVSDANEIVSATITVFVDGTDANGTGATNSCTDGVVYELDPAAGEIDRNAIDISNGTNSIDFNESFEIDRPGTPVNPVTYCFVLTADDEALDNTGAAAPNSATISSEADVTWN